MQTFIMQWQQNLEINLITKKIKKNGKRSK